MQDTSKDTIVQIINRQRCFFRTHQTKDIAFRKQQLLKLKQAVLSFRAKIEEALWEDLHKSPEEAYLTEISIVLAEINLHIKHLKKWAKDTKVKTPLHMLPSSGRMMYEPLGVALIVAPWNYPVQLLLNPLIGAISAGCCAVLKPSPYVPRVSSVLEQMIKATFQEDYITVVQGGRAVNQVLFHQKWDMIFYTGSSSVGKAVMKSASEHLTPLVLELGGKSPCIVDKGADIIKSAKRIVWGKLLNAGQTCIAPDYLWVHQSVKNQLLDRIEAEIVAMFGDNIKASRFFPRIVNDKAMQRLVGLMQKGRIRFGGDVDMSEKYIAPTIIEGVDFEDPIMQEEIFGPLLPVMTFDDVSEVLDRLSEQEKPLAFYYFGKRKQAKDVLFKTTSGGACINDTIMHIANHNLPFGGVGNSGMGKYHGKESFWVFSNRKAINDTPTWIDLPVKYVPYKFFKWIQKFV